MSVNGVQVACSRTGTDQHKPLADVKNMIDFIDRDPVVDGGRWQACWYAPGTYEICPEDHPVALAESAATRTAPRPPGKVDPVTRNNTTSEMSGEARERRIAKVLGQDDWLFYARTADDVLVFYNSDLDWHWLETPHGGQSAGIKEYDDYRRSGKDRIDNS